MSSTWLVSPEFVLLADCRIVDEDSCTKHWALHWFRHAIAPVSKRLAASCIWIWIFPTLRLALQTTLVLISAGFKLVKVNLLLFCAFHCFLERILISPVQAMVDPIICFMFTNALAGDRFSIFFIFCSIGDLVTHSITHSLTHWVTDSTFTFDISVTQETCDLWDIWSEW